MESPRSRPAQAVPDEIREADRANGEPTALDDRAVSAAPDDLIEADAGPDQGRSSAPSDNTTLSAVVAGFEGEGYGAHFVARPGGVLLCDACSAESAAGTYSVATVRRLEGASDPDDMVSVVAAACPACGADGLAVLGYGPTASDSDNDVSSALTMPAAEL